MPLQVYNTLTRKKEPFPKKPGEQVTMYVCGPTVYKPSHIGHMVGPVIFDTVKRYLTYLGYQVTWVVNITDVDDKLIVRAAKLNTTVEGARRADDGGLLRLPEEAERHRHRPLPARRPSTSPDMIDDHQRLDREGLRLPGRRRRLLRRDPGPGLRQAVQPRPGAAGGRRADRGERRRSGTPATSRCGRRRSRASRRGTARGAGPARAGTSSARRWHEAPRRDARHPRRRPRPAVPAPRERAGPVGACTGKPFAQLLDAQRPVEDGQRRRWPARSGTCSTSRTRSKHVTRGRAAVLLAADALPLADRHRGLGPRRPEGPAHPAGSRTAKKSHEAFVRFAERFTA